MKIGLKWVHMGRYGVILRLDGALWHTIISGPLLTQKWFIKIENMCWILVNGMLVAARALATYLIPGCVGRGVRLGSESSSATAAVGGVWKSGNLEIWEFGDLGT